MLQVHLQCEASSLFRGRIRARNIALYTSEFLLLPLSISTKELDPVMAVHALVSGSSAVPFPYSSLAINLVGTSKNPKLVFLLLRFASNFHFVVNSQYLLCCLLFIVDFDTDTPTTWKKLLICLNVINDFF